MNRRTPRLTRSLLLTLLQFAICVPILGQYRDRLGGNWNNPTSASITNIILDRMARRRLEKRLGVGSSAGEPGSAAGARTTPLNDAAVRFRSTGTQLKTREMADQLGGTPAERDQMFTLLSAILQEYETSTKSVGRQHDLAFALSFFFAVNSTVYHGKPEPQDAQLVELRDAIASVLVESGALNGVADRQKQEMYEALVVYTGLAFAGAQAAQQSGDEANLKIYRQLAGQNLQSVIGISPDKIDFTERGLSIDTGSADSTSREAASAESSVSGAIEWWVLLQEYEENEVAANQKYTGKRITVTGTFSHAEMSEGKIVVFFPTPFRAYLHFACYFPTSQGAAVARLKRGDQITVEGISRGRKMPDRIMLEDCVIR